MWANRSFRSSKMSDHERFAQVAQRKWAMWANRSFRSPKMSEWVNRSFFLSKSLIRSFVDKKQAIRSDIKWANSQPRIVYTIIYYRIGWSDLELFATFENGHIAGHIFLWVQFQKPGEFGRTRRKLKRGGWGSLFTVSLLSEPTSFLLWGWTLGWSDIEPFFLNGHYAADQVYFYEGNSQKSANLATCGTSASKFSL